MKKYYVLAILIFCMSCNSTKKVEKAMLSGNYDKAINLALEQIQKGKDNKKTEEQKLILEQAFKKYQDSKLQQIKFLKKDKTSTSEKEIYQSYKDIYLTQNAIKPVLPLNYQDKKLKFEFIDVSSELILAKQNYAENLYQTGLSYMEQNEILAYRKAYETFNQLNKIVPNYKDSEVLAEDALALGKDYIFVKPYNNTEISIPERLEQDILDFNTYGLNDKWTVYHANKKDGNPYQYQVNLIFENINFSPERIIEKERKVERVIEVTEKETDRNGRVKKDSLGNEIEYSRNIIVEGILNTVNQNKSVTIIAQVDYINLANNQKVNDYKLNSQFLFENIFATFEGDERALNDDELQLIKNRAVSFPTNEQMLFDASEDIKLKLKSIIQRFKVR